MVNNLPFIGEEKKDERNPTKSSTNVDRWLVDWRKSRKTADKLMSTYWCQEEDIDFLLF